MALDKTYTRDTHRAVDPRETLERLRPHLARMGITRIANVTGLDRIGIPVVMAMRPNSRSVAVSQGKGLSLDAARASGAMEAAETWHAERISQPLRHARLADLREEVPVADIARLPRVAGSRFTETTRALWIEGRDAASGDPVWLPYEMVHADYTRPMMPAHGAFACSTNGLASGNHPLEATCHAIAEVIERDASAIWHQRPAAGRDATRIDPASVDDDRCREALERLADAGLDAGIWETSSDVGVACFRCLIAEGGGRDGHIGVGEGCHPDRGIALLRAVTEAVQTRMTYISGARDDMAPEEFTPAALRGKSQWARGEIARGEPRRRFADAPHHAGATFEDDLGWLLGRLAAAGCGQVATVDLTRPEIGVAVVRVVIPGLEAPHDDEGYVPGPRARAAA